MPKSKLDPWHFARPELAQKYLQTFRIGLISAQALFAPRRMGKSEFLEQDLIPAAQKSGLLTAYLNLWDAREHPGGALVSALARASSPRGLSALIKKLKAPLKKVKALPLAFTYTQARAAGISAERLYAYRARGLIHQIARGLYRWADAPEIDQDLLEIAHRAPQGTLCLVTALARHGLTDIIPARIDIALPRGSRIPALRKTIDVHIFTRETFDLGREELAVGDKRSVGIYSPERTLVDVIRLRHREGSDVAWEALRRWLTRKGAKPAALLAMAKHFHGAERAVRAALEVVL